MNCIASKTLSNWRLPVTIYSELIAGCWAVFLVYWFVTGIGAKRSAKGGGAHVFLRALIATAVVLFMRSKAKVEPGSYATFASPAVRMLGWFCVR